MSGKEVYCLDKQMIIDEYVNKGKSLNQIAIELGVGWWGIWNRLKKYGVKMRPAHGVLNKTSFKKGEKTGANNVKWKGGIVIHNGYVQIRKLDHPYCDHHGYVKEHRLVMEKHIGRYLNPEEQVHHKNFDKKDNRIENLILFKNNSEHKKYELPQLWIKRKEKSCVS
jgi:hypothetical protein